MKKLIALAFTILLSIAFMNNSFAQTLISGLVRDSIPGDPLAGVNVRLKESTFGTSTDNNGYFQLILDPGIHKIMLTNIGFLSREITVDVNDEPGTSLGFIYMQPSSIGLAEVNIIASEAVDRRTPVSSSTIRADLIESRLGDQPLPEIMKTVPGVYATRTGGGSGDASVNIRGFKQENVSLLLNGVPVGSVENGLVYWNNWLGLADATGQIQVQRGLSASHAAVNAIGGTINIITKTTDIEPGGSLKYSLTDYGNQKATLMLSSGKLPNNMAVTFLGSRFSGPGYVDATYNSGWAYYLSLSKTFSKDHMIVFTALGNPEKHGQRNFRLSMEEIDRYGLKYNKDWGSYNGQINNASENFYHKPHLSLNHYWNMSEKSFLATSFYITPGKGGGKWTDTFSGNPWIFSYYNPSGQIDWDRIYQNNFTNENIYTLADGTDTTGYSLNIQTNFLASHIWTGLLSTYKLEISDNFTVTAGVHGRLFKSKLQQKVRDLLGGQFYIDDYAFAIDGVAGRNQIKTVGDIIKIDNGAIVNYAGLFGQLEYLRGNTSAFISGTFSGNWYRREDRYNYVQDISSDWVYRSGFDFKAGANYNLSESHHIYINGGYFSRAPYYKFVFGNFTNTPTADLKNEKTLAFEAGYGLKLRYTLLKLNAYYTKWEDKSLLTNEYNQFEDPSMISGLDALHRGIEAEVEQRISPWMKAGGSFSLGNWKWKNDVTALVFNDNNVVVDTIRVYADGLYVGDAPQTQFSVFVLFRILKTVDISASWIYYDRFFADFSPTTRTNPDDRSQPYRIPSYHTLDLHVNFPFRIGPFQARANLGCLNALDNKYIIRGQDGAGHNLDTFRGFWGFGRTFFLGFRIDF